MRLLIVFLTGLIFGAGLIISEMTNPAKVIGFLDIFGNWDPSLAFVMIGAITVTLIGFRLVLRQELSWFKEQFKIPENRQIDGKLVFGAVLFGLGWGLVGLCPGPALAVILVHASSTGLFFGMMVAGMFLGRLYMDR